VRNYKQQILKMVKTEQALRMKYLKSFDEKDLRKVNAVDKENREEFKKIFRETGYISSEHGKDVQLAAFLLVQHMPKEDLFFMKKYLSLMKEDLENINPVNYAQLADRVRIYEGKEQMYGTQFELVDKDRNLYRLKEIYNYHSVDKRREKIGLEPLRKYIKKLSKERGIRIEM
jgi:hypothetical protein